MVALALAGLSALGSTGAWATVAGELYTRGEFERFQIGGLIGDGTFTLGLCSLAGLIILWRVARGRATGFLTGLAAVLLLVSAVIAMLNWVDIDNMPGVYQPGKYYHSAARPAWGLLLTTFGAAAGALAMAYQVWTDELR